MKKKTYTVTHHRKKCISCGACELEAPQSWTLDTEDGLSMIEGALEKGQFFVGRILEDDLEDNKRAEQNCPVHIIKIMENGETSSFSSL
ncbi:MAG: ferredoxin [bacterium]|nr:ferredoxin [bacterium]